MMNIVLGIFETYYFRDVATTEGNCAYPFDELDPNIWERFSDIVDIVYFAARKANKIIFLIDGIKPGFDNTCDSVTCKELLRLLQSPAIPVSKIEFMFENKVVSHEFVFERLGLQGNWFTKD